jgi:hypothetical protein
VVVYYHFYFTGRLAVWFWISRKSLICKVLYLVEARGLEPLTPCLQRCFKICVLSLIILKTIKKQAVLLPFQRTQQITKDVKKHQNLKKVVVSGSNF